MAGLSAMSDSGYPQAMVSVLDFAQRYTFQVDFSTVDGASDILEQTHAYADPREASERGIRLILPSSLTRGQNG